MPRTLWIVLALTPLPISTATGPARAQQPAASSQEESQEKAPSSSAKLGEQQSTETPSYQAGNASYSDSAYEYDSTIVPASGYYPSRPYGDQKVTGFVPDYQDDGLYRQPTAVEFLDDQTGFISTKLTGQIFALTKLEGEWNVALVYEDSEAGFTDISRLGQALFAIADPQNNRVEVMRYADRQLQSITKLPAPGAPHHVHWDAKANTLYASGQWSQRLYRWRFAEPLSDKKEMPGTLPDREHVDLPMCGGSILPLPKHNVVLVVDAFGRDYAVIDPERFEVQHAAKLYGHNVPALATTADEEMVFFPHQLLNEYARSVRTDITWGGLMSNNIRWLQTDRLLQETGAEIFRKGRFYPLGTPGNGAGDPSSMAVSSTGRIAITLGGTNRVTIGKADDYYFQQVDVGFRPVDITYSPDESELVVVNQFSDSLSVISLEDFSVQHLQLGKIRAPTQIEKGEQLFFNSRVSHDGWMSCHSCHSQGHTNGQLNDNFTDNTFGTPKRVLSLLGQAQTMPYAWGGTIESLEDQVGHSIRSTMASNSDPDPTTIAAIAAFVRSLSAAPSILEARQDTSGLVQSNLEKQIRKGHRLFRQLNCTDCHSGKQFTTPETYDVGLRDEDEMAHFNPPSLIALSQRQNALFHDASGTSIRQVIEQGQHQLARPITASEQAALIRFLESL